MTKTSELIISNLGLPTVSVIRVCLRGYFSISTQQCYHTSDIKLILEEWKKILPRFLRIRNYLIEMPVEFVSGAIYKLFEDINHKYGVNNNTISTFGSEFLKGMKFIEKGEIIDYYDQ